MNQTFQRRHWALGATAVGVAALLAVSAHAQSIQIQIPKMSERSAAGAPAGAPAAQSGAYGAQPAQASGYGTQGAQQSAYGTAAGSSQGYGGSAQQSAYGTTSSSYGTAQGAYGTSQGAYGSTTQGSYGTGQSAYGGGSSYGTAQHSSSGTINGPAPTKPTAGQPCKVTMSPERQTLILVGTTDNLPRANIPLGDFRAQTVVHAPDGRWAVAFLKLRGQAQFAMFTMDLTECKEGHTVDLAQAGEDATFEGDKVTVRAGGKTQQWPLANPRLR